MNFSSLDTSPRFFIGVSLRTSHANAPQDIPKFWARVLQDEVLGQVEGAQSSHIHAIYHDLEDEWRGAYTMSLVVEVKASTPIPEGMELLEIPARRAVQTTLASGQPEVLMGAWNYIWHDWPERDRRAYQFDIETHRETGVTIELSMA